jgi:hypothetical protein
MRAGFNLPRRLIFPTVVPSSRMRRALLLVGFQLLAFTGAFASDVSFVRVWTGWRDLDPYMRISEYFNGRVNMGGRIILRTHAEARAGFYYLVRVKTDLALVSGVKFVVQVIFPSSPVAKMFIFPTDIPAHGKVYELGLTGIDWPGKKTYPVAWKLDLLGPDGQLLATQQSFLWSKPN